MLLSYGTSTYIQATAHTYTKQRKRAIESASKERAAFCPANKASILYLVHACSCCLYLPTKYTYILVRYHIPHTAYRIRSTKHGGDPCDQRSIPPQPSKATPEGMPSS